MNKSCLLALLLLVFPQLAFAQDWQLSYQKATDNQSSTMTELTQTIANAGSCTNATPMVCTWTANKLVNGMAIILSGSIPGGFTAGVTYYVVAKATNSFELAATPGGSALASSSSTSPTATISIGQYSLILNNTTDNTIGNSTVPSLTNVARSSSGSFLAKRVRLSTSVTSGWDQAAFIVRLWSAAPTYSAWSNLGPYDNTVPTTGSANLIAQFNVTLSQFGDGASGFGYTPDGNPANITLTGGGTTVYWDLEYIGGGTLTPITGQTYTLVLEEDK